jgi:hypothetical protein
LQRGIRMFHENPLSSKKKLLRKTETQIWLFKIRKLNEKLYKCRNITYGKCTGQTGKTPGNNITSIFFLFLFVWQPCLSRMRGEFPWAVYEVADNNSCCRSPWPQLLFVSADFLVVIWHFWFNAYQHHHLQGLGLLARSDHSVSRTGPSISSVVSLSFLPLGWQSNGFQRIRPVGIHMCS